VDHAGKLGYQDLDRAAAKLVEAIDPDGILPSDEAEHRLRRFFHLKQRQDGSWAGDFRLTPEVGQKLAALLGPLMKPQTTTVDPDDTDGGANNKPGQSGQPGGSGKKHVEQDERTQGQRRHDALESVIDLTLNSEDLPATGGTPTTLIITMSWQEFTAVRGGVGSYADGSPVSAQTARRLADQAEVAFCVKSEKGAVLDMYRTRRIATPTQTLALIARDGGCSFPGCEVAPQWCERHHVIAWYDGGPTNIGNLTLVCGFHHRHFAQRGWRCQINTDGLPVWIPPKWIDPQQRPIMHHRIIINNWDPHQPLDLNVPLDFSGPDEPDPPDPPPDRLAGSS
ncbi:MAG TPA: DUF222 domain-containing protein, partial [Microlunatus sp.]|nr:DUF222 domain-containing protein [Microlunatus sp.]